MLGEIWDRALSSTGKKGGTVTKQCHDPEYYKRIRVLGRETRRKSQRHPLSSPPAVLTEEYMMRKVSWTIGRGITMVSPSLLQDGTLPSNRHNGKEDVCADGIGREQVMLLQEERQAFDMAIDEVLDGLSDVQQILGVLKAECFSGLTSTIAPATRLKVQRASHHCGRLIAEVQQLLQPLPDDLEALILRETPSRSLETITSNEKRKG